MDDDTFNTDLFVANNSELSDEVLKIHTLINGIGHISIPYVWAKNLVKKNSSLMNLISEYTTWRNTTLEKLKPSGENGSNPWYDSRYNAASGLLKGIEKKLVSAKTFQSFYSRLKQILSTIKRGVPYYWTVSSGGRTTMYSDRL